MPEKTLTDKLKIPLERTSVRIIPNVIFYQKFDWKRVQLRINILVPKTPHPVPCLVYVPGGGFLTCSRTNHLQLQLHLAETGFVVASVQYRVVGEGTLFEALCDIKSAIRFLRAQASNFNIAVENFAIMGESAGGYLATMVGASNGCLRFEVGENLQQSSDVSAAINLFGYCDLKKLSEDSSQQLKKIYASPSSSHALFVSGIPPFYGEHITEDSHDEFFDLANPANYISARTSAFLFLHGEDDEIVPPEQTRLFHETLLERGIKSVRYVIQGAGHAGETWCQPQIERLLVEFLNEHLVL